MQAQPTRARAERPARGIGVAQEVPAETQTGFVKVIARIFFRPDIGWQYLGLHGESEHFIRGNLEPAVWSPASRCEKSFTAKVILAIARAYSEQHEPPATIVSL